MKNGLYLVVTLLVFGLGVECGRLPSSKAAANSWKNKKMHKSFPYNGMTVEETIEANPNNMVATYHLKAGDEEGYVVDDYEMYIRVVRIGDLCVAAPMDTNRTFSSGEEFAVWATDTNRPMIQESVHVSVNQRKQPIGRTDFLSIEAQQKCDGLPIYWADKDDGTKLDTKRMKRDLYRVVGVAIIGGRAYLVLERI